MEKEKLAVLWETSLELVEAIEPLITTERNALDILADPTDDEFEAILKKAFANTERTEMNWGCLIVTRDGIKGIDVSVDLD